MPKAKHVEGRVRDVTLAAMVVSGKSIRSSRRALGMMGAQGLTQTQKDLVSSMREELQGKKGMRLEDSADYYLKASVATGQTKRDADQLRARARLDSILGYDAPQKVEDVTERREVTNAVIILQQLAANGVTPMAIREQINQRRIREVKPEMIEVEEAV